MTAAPFVLNVTTRRRRLRKGRNRGDPHPPTRGRVQAATTQRETALSVINLSPEVFDGRR